MSEEVAQAIGDVLAENERLRRELAQAEAHAARYWVALRRLAAAWRREQQRTAEQEEQIAQLAALAVENED